MPSDLVHRLPSRLAVLRDAAFAVRALRRHPAFTLTAVLALAVGIGASTAVYAVVDAILVRPLPYADAGRLVVLLHGGERPVAPAEFLDWQREARGFARMGAAEAWGATLTGTDRPERLRALRVTPEIFPLLGVRPLFGRAPGAHGAAAREVAISHALWQRRFAADPGVIGRAVALDGDPYVVVGVMPPRFRFAPFWATESELWAPLDLASGAADRDAQTLRVFARLAPGVTLAQARASVAAVTARTGAEHASREGVVTVTPLLDKVVGGVRPMLLALLAAVGLVLAMTCANVAHMLLVRGSARGREMAIRASLGASRGRLVRLLLTESLLVASAGGAIGLALGALGVRMLVAAGPADLPRLDAVRFDTRVMLATVLATLVSAVACGLVPALRTAAAGAAVMLRDGGRGATAGRAHHRTRRLLVASEFAMALVLLAGAGLMVRSVLALHAVDPGLDARGVLTAVVSVTGTPQAEPGRRAAFYQELLTRLRAVPGVRAASAINHVPLAGDVWGTTFRVEGRRAATADEEPRATYRVVLPGYFATMGIRILRGRDVAAHDDAGARGAVIVNQTLARRRWPNGDAIGRRLSIDDGPDPAWRTVVGVVEDVVRGDWTEPPGEELYVPYLQSPPHLERPSPPFTYLTVVARVDGDPAALAPVLRRTVWSLAPDLPVSEVETMEQVVADATARPRFLLALLASFAAVAVGLAAVGLYAVTSHAVAKRAPEIGVRMALGARRRDVIRIVVGEALALAAAGTALGLVGAAALAPLVGRLLYGIRPGDPATFVAAAVGLTLVALAASWLPARRAVRVGPATALRHD